MGRIFIRVLPVFMCKNIYCTEFKLICKGENETVLNSSKHIFKNKMSEVLIYV